MVSMFTNQENQMMMVCSQARLQKGSFGKQNLLPPSEVLLTEKTYEAFSTY